MPRKSFRRRAAAVVVRNEPASQLSPHAALPPANRRLDFGDRWKYAPAPETAPVKIDLPLVAAHFFYYAGWADKLDYAVRGRKPQPLGVCGQVIPWNFPLLMAAWKLVPALACGNTCVLKPAETTSITAMHLARILQE